MTRLPIFISLSKIDDVCKYITQELHTYVGNEYKIQYIIHYILVEITITYIKLSCPILYGICVPYIPYNIQLKYRLELYILYLINILKMFVGYYHVEIIIIPCDNYFKVNIMTSSIMCYRLLCILIV